MDIEGVISAAFSLPPENAGSVPKITLAGRERIRVENYSALLEYREDNVKLKISDGVIEIMGENLEIRAIGEENIVISGKIRSVRFV